MVLGALIASSFKGKTVRAPWFTVEDIKPDEQVFWRP